MYQGSWAKKGRIHTSLGSVSGTASSSESDWFVLLWGKFEAMGASCAKEWNWDGSFRVRSLTQFLH